MTVPEAHPELPDQVAVIQPVCQADQVLHGMTFIDPAGYPYSGAPVLFPGPEAVGASGPETDHWYGLGERVSFIGNRIGLVLLPAMPVVETGIAVPEPEKENV